MNGNFLRSEPRLALQALGTPYRSLLQPHHWLVHCYFPVSFKPKVWEEGSTCNLTCMSWNESIFPNIGLISIIRKTKGTKAPVSSVLITLLVIRATIEIQDKTKKLEITLRRVIHGRDHWVQNRHTCMCIVKQDLEKTQGWKWKSQLHKHWISESGDILYLGRLKPSRRVDMGREERFGRVEHISFYFVKTKEHFDIAAQVISSLVTSYVQDFYIKTQKRGISLLI